MRIAQKQFTNILEGKLSESRLEAFKIPIVNEYEGEHKIYSYLILNMLFVKLGKLNFFFDRKLSSHNLLQWAWFLNCSKKVLIQLLTDYSRNYQKDKWQEIKLGILRFLFNKFSNALYRNYL
ncbi:MAG: hypothetical protein CL868_06165 [Cytophagaceae bacterium]|nr:hypothetical protein [Cytophagaceae bacterium]|tara:strand:- start:1220 stop:1585 length:366 start_codon:yes stop_codon:yes gene_type:complete